MQTVSVKTSFSFSRQRNNTLKNDDKWTLSTFLVSVSAVVCGIMLAQGWHVIIIIKVFVKWKILSIESILSAHAHVCTHAQARARTHTHTHTQRHLCTWAFMYLQSKLCMMIDIIIMFRAFKKKMKFVSRTILMIQFLINLTRSMPSSVPNSIYVLEKNTFSTLSLGHFPKPL